MEPDPARLASLSAVIARDLGALRRLHTQLTELSGALDVTAPAFRDMAATAYVLHNLYNALENSFEQISRTFENHITIPDQWHRELLGKMFLEIPTVRPAVLPDNLRTVLNDLRGFRHLFRHAYDFELDAEKLRRLVRDWTVHQVALSAALNNFRNYLLEKVGKQPG